MGFLHILRGVNKMFTAAVNANTMRGFALFCFYGIMNKLSCYLNQPRSTSSQIHPSCSNDGAIRLSVNPRLQSHRRGINIDWFRHRNEIIWVRNGVGEPKMVSFRADTRK